MAQDSLFELIGKLAQKDDALPLSQHDGCWVRRIDHAWIIAVNAHETPQHCEPPDCMGLDVAPFECVVWFNGWLAGMMSPFEGLIAAGERANETTFRTALVAAIAA